MLNLGYIVLDPRNEIYINSKYDWQHMPSGHVPTENSGYRQKIDTAAFLLAGGVAIGKTRALPGAVIDADYEDALADFLKLSGRTG